MKLERTDVLDKALPFFVKRFRITTEIAWQILRQGLANGGTLSVWLINPDSSVRNKVNVWWNKNRSSFGQMHIGSLKLKPSKLPEAVYQQFICLVWLAEKLKEEKGTKEKVRVEVEIAVVRARPEEKLGLWYRLIRWLKKL